MLQFNVFYILCVSISLCLLFPCVVFTFSAPRLNWTVSVDDSAITSVPVFIAPSYVVVTTHAGTVSVVDTVSGHHVTPWPIHFPGKAFFAGALLYDVDENGVMDIVLTSSDGEIIFISNNGTVLTEYTIALPRLLIKQNWNTFSKEMLLNSDQEPPDMNPGSNTIFMEKSQENSYNKEHYILMDTHVLSTPVLTDVNNDNYSNELVMPINYYFDDDIKSDKDKLQSLLLEESKVDIYLASALIIVDLKTKKVIFKETLELTTKSSLFPCYLLSSPIVIDLDGQNDIPEILIGSMSGRIHVYNKFGRHKLDISMSDSIHGEIATGDVNNDGVLEVVAVDGSGNVACFGMHGVLWEASVSGTMTAGAQLVDINQDGRLDVVIAANDGYLWILNGLSGKIFEHSPSKHGDMIHSKVLLIEQHGQPLCVFMSDENLNIINITDGHVQVIATDIHSYTPVILDHKQQSLIVSTSDGKLLSLRTEDDEETTTYSPLQNTRIQIRNRESNIITTANFKVDFEIHDGHHIEDRWKFYHLTIQTVSENGIYHVDSQYEHPGIYTIDLRSPKTPMKSYVSLVICNQFKECTKDKVYFQFHPDIKDSLGVYVMVPFLVMVALLLLLHGYPDGDLLPTWQHNTH